MLQISDLAKEELLKLFEGKDAALHIFFAGYG